MGSLFLSEEGASSLLLSDNMPSVDDDNQDKKGCWWAKYARLLRTVKAKQVVADKQKDRTMEYPRIAVILLVSWSMVHGRAGLGRHSGRWGVDLFFDFFKTSDTAETIMARCRRLPVLRRATWKKMFGAKIPRNLLFWS